VPRPEPGILIGAVTVPSVSPSGSVLIFFALVEGEERMGSAIARANRLWLRKEEGKKEIKGPPTERDWGGVVCSAASVGGKRSRSSG